ncbi:hypothetical protein H7H82_01025 [Mycobacterium heidelbergense]|uniref:Uncharacterized protein n=1 Tax=Mycobacterium heidelbergense TaxID=53376 RepID=A0A1X0DAY8_MYCHE|nr:hypothetical protein [Mycobacterium heidelbergense]MCV7049204.1 hypothetical protein [Mycobacterium heidelbergense]ORA69537.1 hypothetical protein BST25_21300 [Mycobacterium heidelbergense]
MFQPGTEPIPATLEPRAEITPAGAETGTEPTSAWSERAPTRLPSIPTSTGIPQPGVKGIEQSAAQPADDGGPVAQYSVCAIHDGSDGVTHQRGTVIGNRGNQAGPIPVVRVITAIRIRVIAPIRGGVAVLIGQDLLQTADRVAAEVQTGHRIRRRHRELVGCRIDPGLGHRLLGTIKEGLGRFWTGEQGQDVFDQRVHDRFPSKL